MATTEQFSLRWNNFHSNLTSGFHDLLQANDMVDVTLAIEGQFLQAHKIVLSICSPLFKQLFKINPCKHPVIILRDVTYGNLKDILEFMYLGEVNVLRDNLSAFLRTAELLQIKGLTGDDSSDTSSKKDEKLDSICDNELEQDMQQFSQLIESSDSSLIPHYSTPQLPSPPPIPAAPVSNIKRPAKNSIGNSKRAKSDTGSSQSSKSITKTVEKHERSSTPIQTSEDDPEYVESPNLKVEAVAYGSESEDTVSNREVIKQLLESNSVNLSTAQDSSSQDHEHTANILYCPHCPKTFKLDDSLKKHISNLHGSDQGPFMCHLCGRITKNRNSLYAHRHKVHKRLPNGLYLP